MSRDQQSVNFERIRFDVDLLAVGDQSYCFRPVYQRPQLGKTPAQLASRIIGDIPKEFAEPFARNGPPRHCEVSKQSKDLARRRLGSRAFIPDNLQRSQQKQTVGGQAYHFHDRSNARTNGNRLLREVFDTV